MMTLEAAKELSRLHQKWVSSKGTPNIDFIQAQILRELRAANAGKITVTDSLKTEMRGELVLCGKIRKTLSSAHSEGE